MIQNLPEDEKQKLVEYSKIYLFKNETKSLTKKIRNYFRFKNFFQTSMSVEIFN